MHRLRLYLDTSVISLLFQDESAERQEITKAFVDNVVRKEAHDAFVSSVVLDEIAQTPDEERRGLMLDILAELPIPVLEYEPGDSTIRQLANLYTGSGIIPRSKPEDALHVAIATIHEIDILITWNYQHLAGITREMRIAAANLSLGFTKQLRLMTPMEMAFP